jgi:hypothetical protein
MVLVETETRDGDYNSFAWVADVKGEDVEERRDAACCYDV